MDNLCRFCGFDLSGEVKNAIGDSEIIQKFYRSLPTEVQSNDCSLPKIYCSVCNLKITESVQFYDAVIENDRNLKSMLQKPAQHSIETPPKTPSPRQVRLRRLSELVKYREEAKATKAKVSTKPKTEIISEIYDKLKKKTNLTVSKFVDTDDDVDDGNNDDEHMEDSECELTGLKNEVCSDSTDDDDDVDNGDTPEVKRRTRNVVKNPPIISLEHIQPKFVCARCSGRFKSLQELRDHRETNNSCKDSNIVCGDCKKVFKTRRVFTKHVRDVHEKKEPVVHKCTNCEEIFPRECELQNHRVLCTGICNEDFSGILFKCKDCDKTFVKRIELLKHIENHTKKLLCETCGKSCNTKKAYSQHVREHLGLKPYKCGLCEKRFRTNTLLQAHQHVHTGVKSFVCDTCGKTFAKRASLIYHVRLHTGETPYGCELCTERFTTSDRLKNHLRRHRQNFYVE